MPSKRRVKAEDLYRLELISTNALSPDGEHVVYCQHRVDKKTEKKYSDLWIVPVAGGKPLRFTHGDHVDASPKWSPDGKSIAFISNRADEKQPQLYVIPFGGGEARKLTDLKGSISSFEWSPDGRSFAVAFRKKDKEVLEREKDERKKKLGVVSRHITRMFFKEDEKGFLPKERTHIWTVDARSGKAKQLTKGPVHDELMPTWSPDGGRIVFVSNRSEDPDMNPDVMDLYSIPAKGGAMLKIPTHTGPAVSPRFSPDGKWIAYFGIVGRGAWWRNMNLFVVPVRRLGPARNLTGRFDVHVTSWTINDVGYGPPQMPPVWSKNGKALYFQVARHGSTTLHGVDVEARRPKLETLIATPGVVGMFDFTPDESKVAFFRGDTADPGQIAVRDLATGETRDLTKLNASYLKGLDLGEMEEVWFKGAANNDLQGWILKPPGFNPKRKYPSILEIHGGPRVQYGNFFFHEMYFLAAKGYVVYLSNPRGGQGYGERHSKSILNRWGTVDYDDLMAWTDLMARKPYIDAKRMGVTGGSYGGYMTNWIIGHTRRFKAAVTQRSVSNLISMYGSSDFNWAFQEEFGDRPPWETFANYWQQSPIKHIGNARTPTLVIHSEEDLRCAIEQSEQVYVALKKMGVDTEMVRFPEEPHGLSRGGRTDRRIVRLNHILRWFDKYLK